MSYADKPTGGDRTGYMKQLAVKAKSLFSSETATPEEKEFFLKRNTWYLDVGVNGTWGDDSKYTDLMALVVLDDVPHEVISNPRTKPHKAL